MPGDNLDSGHLRGGATETLADPEITHGEQGRGVRARRRDPDDLERHVLLWAVLCRTARRFEDSVLVGVWCLFGTVLLRIT